MSPAGASGATASRDAGQAANGAPDAGSSGPSPLGRYIAELTSIRGTLVKASEEHLAMQKQLQEARFSRGMLRCCWSAWLLWFAARPPSCEELRHGATPGGTAKKASRDCQSA